MKFSIKIPGVVVILIIEVGVYAMLTCLGVFFVVYAPLQLWMSKYLNLKRQEVSKITDRRVRVMNEVLSAMKLVKLYHWEQSFAERVLSPLSTVPISILHIILLPLHSLRG